jgi:hypothetical protein
MSDTVEAVHEAIREHQEKFHDVPAVFSLPQAKYAEATTVLEYAVQIDSPITTEEFYYSMNREPPSNDPDIHLRLLPANAKAQHAR